MKLGYQSRKERAAYTCKKYGEFLQRRILDVGCGDAYLKELVGSEYAGIDFAGKPDVIFDPEQEKLPFKDNSFDCVVCTEGGELDELDKTRYTVSYV